jgi:3-hydroxyisobutyrate dehydrogenase
VSVIAHDRDAQAMARLAGSPVRGDSLRAASGLDDFGACSIVITMLPNSPATNALLIGTDDQPGLLPRLSPGTLIIDMGSSNPQDTLALARTVHAAGLALVDAPVSGAVVKARSGQLAIMIGGSETDVARARAIVAHMGSTIIPTGAVGSAHAMKALNNYVYAAGLMAASEALLLAGKMGLDLDIFTDVLNASSGRNVATESKLRQFIVPRTFNGGFSLGLQAKDLATAATLQAPYGTDAPLLTLCAATWREAVATIGVQADNTEIFRFLEERGDRAVTTEDPD